jgi:hypothetical protein
MRCSQRLIAVAVLIALSGALAGCGGGGFSSFDPTDWLDFLDTKKKLPGERKPVFPDGVPGLEQGVPKELYKGSEQERIDRQNAQAAAAAAAPPVEPKGKRGAKGKQPVTANTAPAQQPAAAASEGAAAEEEGGTAAAPPAPKPKKIVRKRTTAPPPDAPVAQQPPAQQPAAAQPQQQSASPFPAPLPGTLQR